MKKMFLLFNHTLTTEQKADAIKNLRVDEFISLPQDLQTLWSNVPSNIESLREYLLPIKEYMVESVQTKDIVLIQGDFGATSIMVEFVNSMDAIPVYATTLREVLEEQIDDEIHKKSIFRHVRFRRYE